MKRYAVSCSDDTVVWKASALDQLAEVWLQAADRQAVTTATAQVDNLLGVDPLGCGADLREGLRVVEIQPLRVIFAVQDEDRLVEVARVSRHVFDEALYRRRIPSYTEEMLAQDLETLRELDSR